MARADDLVDKGRPVVRPFLLQYRDEHEVELVEQGALALKGLFGAGALHDTRSDEISDSQTLVAREYLPSCHDNMVEDLETKI